MGSSGGSYQGGLGFARGASMLVGDPVAARQSPFWFGNTNRPMTIDDIVNGASPIRLPPPQLAAPNSTTNPGVQYAPGIAPPRNYLLEAFAAPQATQSVWKPGDSLRTTQALPGVQLQKNISANKFVAQGYNDNQGNLYNKSGVKRAKVGF